MKIFIAGPRAVTSLDESFEKRLHGIIDKNHSVLIGDALGVDQVVQSYFFNFNYPNVTVYASNGKARVNIGKWPIVSVPVSEKIKGFDFYAAKDKVMADNADYGFMLWNGKSRGTLTNIINLLARRKKILLYLTLQNSFIIINNYEKLENILSICGDNTRKLYNRICSVQNLTQSQTSIFDNVL